MDLPLATKVDLAILRYQLMDRPYLKTIISLGIVLSLEAILHGQG
jgi:hypothetical protein